MPKSRGRKTRKPRTNQRKAAPRAWTQPREGAGAGPLGELAPFWPLLLAADEAEVRGDALTALEIVAEHPEAPDGSAFWRPERVRRLAQLVALGPLLPRWATSRWTLAQALQVLEPSSRGRGFKAMEIAIETRGGPETLGGDDEAAARTRVMDHDWVYRQLFLYDLGGLDHFLRRVATPDLLAGADRIRDWAATPMGGYRLVAETSKELTWEDLGDGGEVRTINLGAATMTLPGGFVLGRVVPTEEGSLFESAPLVVPEGAALDVARDPGGWVDAVARACRNEYPAGEDDDPCITGDFDFGMLTDVPRITQHYLQHVAAGISFATHDRCQLSQFAARLVRRALDDTLDAMTDEETKKFDSPLSGWPSVAAALVEPHVGERLLRALGPADADAMLRLARRLPRPAADVCRGLAGMLRDAA